MTSLLPIAIELATKAHGTQMNMDGTLYLLHPLRLMMQCKREDEQIVAILHDAVEDTDLTLDQIREAGLAASPYGFDVDVLDAIDRLTKRESETDAAYLDRVSGSYLAMRIKLLDLHDNIDLTRLPTVTQRDADRALKYHNAIRFFEENLSMAPQSLH